ncbi:MAG: hypothetical protein E6K52_02410 [Gammaproteobacteria bacterium]|nr:MAG: hypothetical protein E6K52_02410 [Gammaproteobacteria bacterium]
MGGSGCHSALAERYRSGSACGGSSLGDLYFGPYYGPQMDGLTVFGYVGKLTVYFPAALPKKMTAYIQGLGC